MLWLWNSEYEKSQDACDQNAKQLCPPHIFKNLLSVFSEVTKIVFLFRKYTHPTHKNWVFSLMYTSEVVFSGDISYFKMNRSL
jgi:hypothetical protein